MEAVLSAASGCSQRRNIETDLRCLDGWGERDGDGSDAVSKKQISRNNISFWYK
jgi:hypothetical protein